MGLSNANIAFEVSERSNSTTLSYLLNLPDPVRSFALLPFAMWLLLHGNRVIALHIARGTLAVVKPDALSTSNLLVVLLELLYELKTPRSRITRAYVMHEQGEGTEPIEPP